MDIWIWNPFFVYLLFRFRNFLSWKKLRCPTVTDDVKAIDNLVGKQPVILGLVLVGCSGHKLPRKKLRTEPAFPKFSIQIFKHQGSV